MGATGWSYFTPFQTDVEQALQNLRREVFESGVYGQAHATPEQLAAMPPELREALENLREIEAESLGGKDREFGSIDELLEASAENGTHSILDILQTADTPDFAVAWPAAMEAVEDIFGSSQPSHEEIEDKQGELTERLELERWQAVYLTVYKGGKPVEIYFEGVSGD